VVSPSWGKFVAGEVRAALLRGLPPSPLQTRQFVLRTPGAKTGAGARL